MKQLWNVKVETLQEILTLGGFSYRDKGSVGHISPEILNFIRLGLSILDEGKCFKCMIDIN